MLIIECKAKFGKETLIMNTVFHSLEMSASCVQFEAAILILGT